MEEKNEDLITYTFSASSLTCISAEEIVEKFGAMIFYTDRDYILWCRKNMGGNNRINKIEGNER